MKRIISIILLLCCVLFVIADDYITLIHKKDGSTIAVRCDDIESIEYTTETMSSDGEIKKKCLVNGINYVVDYNTLEAEVTYNGSGNIQGDLYCTYKGSVVIPSFVEYENLRFKVTAIGSNAFADCTKLSDVTIPSSVASIGENAFAMSSIKSVLIPNSVSRIGKGAFYMSSLVSIILPKSISRIEEETFMMSRLSSIYIPNSVSQIDASAFAHCSELTSIDLPESLESIGEYAFQSSGIESVVIPSKITTIENSCFNDCYQLKSVILPSSINEIKYGSFSYCPKLEEITCLSEKVPKIGIEAFLGISANACLYVVSNAFDEYNSNKEITSYLKVQVK